MKWFYFLGLSLVLGTQIACSNSSDNDDEPAIENKPNIIFVILDDWGMDQSAHFGYGGVTPPEVPNLNALAESGVSFRNAWAAPECSAARVSMFTGRYPLRTSVYAAILDEDLANSLLSAFETTTPMVMRAAGYTSGLFGKYHLGGPANNPFGSLAPGFAGWDYYDGNIYAAPPGIDDTGGGLAVGTEKFSCGFDPANEAGACYTMDTAPQAESLCSLLVPDSKYPAPGRKCMEDGGLFLRGANCQTEPPTDPDFEIGNGYYNWPHTVIDSTEYHAGTADAPTLVVSDINRTYATTQTTDAAIGWIKKQQQGSKPWMATVSYNAIHTPYQQAPDELLPMADPIANSALNCTDGSSLLDFRILGNQMAEAMDKEIGRLLVETGIATRDASGNLDYDPGSSDTMIVWVGDNGTFFPSVKAPFDLTHSKGTPYQTGVWVGMAATGPLVHSDNRGLMDNHMINVVDLFELWGEIGGIDVRSVVPETQILDSESMLPYLVEPSHTAIRTSNFSQLGTSLKAPGVTISPCVLNLGVEFACTDILFTDKSQCDIASGKWYGEGSDVTGVPAGGFSSCCDVKSYASPGTPDQPLVIVNKAGWTTRNDDYKLNRLLIQNCDTNEKEVDWEFYQVDQKPVLPRIDRPQTDVELVFPPNDLLVGTLSLEEQQNCTALFDEMQAIFNSVVGDKTQEQNGAIYCEGDGTLDKIVNEEDRACVKRYMSTAFAPANPGESSWCDMNFDGITNAADLAIVETNLGKDCREAQRVAVRDQSPCD